MTGRPTSTCSPGETTVTRSATRRSASAICVRTASIVNTGASVARRLSTSRWSRCSWVMSTAVAPSTASRSVKAPGSMTTTWPSCSMRTQAWPNFVILMVQNLCRARGHPGLTRAGCRRSTSASPRPARPSASPGGRLSSKCAAGVPARRGVAAADVAARPGTCAGAPRPASPSRTQSSQTPVDLGRGTSRGALPQVLAGTRSLPAIAADRVGASSSALPCRSLWTSSIDSSTSSAASTLLDHLVRDRAGAAHLSTFSRSASSISSRSRA